MSDNEDLVCAFVFDGKGGGRALDWADIEKGPPVGDGLVWIHLNRRAERVQQWLKTASGLDPLVVEALLAEDSRPRFSRFGEGSLLNLRGVNLNPGEEPEDMVTARMWLAPGLIVSVRRLRIVAIRDLRLAIEAGSGPTSIGSFVAQFATRLTERMEPVIDGLDEELGELEETALALPSQSLRQQLGVLRRKAITLRRYIGSQRDALSNLILADVDWMEPRDRERLREQADRVTRYVEELDALRERAYVLQDELLSLLSERMNRTMYLLTIVAAIFLPISFLTGLLGINVGGMPGADDTTAFWVVTGLLAVIAVGEFLLFRRFRWI